jgi:glycosyltransferase involved in cell wall biosynthesis
MHASTLTASPASAPAEPDISVVIATCGRVDLLDRCLDALMRQLLEARRFEIIVVDEQPRQDTRQLVAVWRAGAGAGGPAIHYAAHAGPPGPAAARNLGWRRARAPIVAFTEDDTVPAPGWLRHALSAFGEHVDALTGPVHIPLPARPTDGERVALQLRQGEFVMANCFCRKHILELLGGFDERFHSSSREARDLHFRLLAMRANIARAPHASVVHPLRSLAWGTCLAQQRHAVADALLYKKHPQLYRQKIAPSPCWADLATVAALLAAGAAAVPGQRMLAAAALAAWALLTARLALRRLRGTSRALPHVAGVLFTSALLPPLAVYWRLAGALRHRVPFA